MNRVNTANTGDSVDTRDPVHTAGAVNPVNTQNTRNPVHTQKPVHTAAAVNPVNTRNPVHPVHTQKPVNSVNAKKPVNSVNTKKPVNSINTSHAVNSVNTIPLRTPGWRLYARSRALPLTVLALAATTGFAVWAAHRLDTYVDPDRRVPVVALAPLLAAAVIGVSLHTASDELDRTAVRPWWPRRLVQLAGLTALAATLLPLAVLGHTEVFGTPAVVRNTLGCTGVTAAAAALLGARLSWLPAFGYVSAVYLASSGVRGRAATVWAWPVQPGAQTGAWAVALLAFAAGAALYAVRGARAEGPRD